MPECTCGDGRNELGCAVHGEFYKRMDYTERVLCMNCGKSVSSPVPVGTVVRAWVQCPECLEKGIPVGVREEVLEEAAQVVNRLQTESEGDYFCHNDTVRMCVKAIRALMVARGTHG